MVPVIPKDFSLLSEVICAAPPPSFNCTCKLISLCILWVYEDMRAGEEVPR